MFLSTQGPWPWGKEQREDGRPLPGPRLTGGEGWVGGNEEEVDAHLLVLGIEARVVGKVGVDGERWLAELAYGGGVTLVALGDDG